MKLRILILLLLTAAEVFGSRQSSRNRKISSSCGKQMTQRRGHHLGGPRVIQGSYPWNAALITNDKYFCGGTLISNKEVVTAAHCIRPKTSFGQLLPKNITVILGHYDLTKLNGSGITTVPVKTIRLHPHWNPMTQSFDADIAILELDQEVQFTNSIQPICLIEPRSDVASLTEGIVVGYETYDNGKIANIPRVLDTPITSYHDCKKDENYLSLLSRRTICGGRADGTGVCFGDSGSGLLVFKNGTYYLRGIVSASLYSEVSSCDFNAYSIFSDAVRFYMWMKAGDEGGL
ncbi:serine protease gd-like [Chironomus tepperi]|uniref:serine protease gd-like n=1 Tax=Chironomus tepperi TaxID=113505 RepID=UPI00391F0E4A